MLKQPDLDFERRDLDRALADGVIGDASPIFVDFDHTLFACNSTELFIASCRPAAAIALIDFVVRRCVPWRLTGIEQWFRLRDYVCCIVILVASPWNLLLWRRAAPRLFARHVSPGIAEALSKVPAGRVTVVTFGMEFIVRPLLRGGSWQAARLVATPLLARPGYFARGKLDLLGHRFDADAIASSAFVTDSMDDGDLLEAAGTGILVEPQGDVFRASEHLYLPLRYTARAKYSPSYVFDQIVFVESLATLIAVAHGVAGLLADLPVVALFTLSLMCVYEIGYYENDMVAATRETAPTLTEHVARFASFPMQPAAWLWAICAGVAGGLAACRTGVLTASDLPTVAAIWTSAMIVLRILFRVYNGARLQARLVLYPVLQVMKFLPIFLVIPPTRIGAVLILSQIATMWMIYLVYRHGGNQKTVAKELIRTVLVALGVGLLAASTSSIGPGGEFALTLVALWSAARLSKAPILRALRQRRAAARA